MAGEIVHVIAHRWVGANQPKRVSIDGRLIVHRVALDTTAIEAEAIENVVHGQIARAMLSSSFPSQAFSWQAALLAEQLVDREGIDVIEAQEWEAPLYYFQRRCELNLGPTRRPPCVIHLHSSTEQIFDANAWDSGVDDFPPAVAMESYSIKTADAVLCPSRFMAQHALARYGLDESMVNVIRYPLGQVPHLDRSSQTWSGGSICYIGRLEPRKGVLEWADAIASVAVDHPDLTFEFVGSDTPLRTSGTKMVGDEIRARVPHRVRRQLVFHGPRDRTHIVETLRRAWAAAVPSRWENFPYSCLESMATGLPVVVSPNGGMKEIVEDGVSGWIASEAGSAGLAAALRRAVSTSATERAKLGGAAAAIVRRICDNDEIVRSHIDLKRKLIKRRATAASQVTLNGSVNSGGMIVVISGAANDPDAHECLTSVRAQTVTPEKVHTLSGGSPDELGDDALGLISTLDARTTGVVFARADARLTPECLATCRRVFAEHQRLGLMSAWTRNSAGQLGIQPNPDVPYIGHDAGIAPIVAVRVTALQEALRVNSHRIRSMRALFEDVKASGWETLTYPSVLSTYVSGKAPRRPPARYSPVARAVRRSHMPLLEWLRETSSEDLVALARRALITPARLTARLLTRTVRE
jgi:glycogen(starch) synthase